MFVKGLFVGNISAPAETSHQQPSSSYDVCGPYMEYTPKTSRPERCKYIFVFTYLFPPMYNFSKTLTFIVFCSYKFQTTECITVGWPYVSVLFIIPRPNAVIFTWPALSNQKPNDLSAGRFFYTGE